jgi:hypothetical protein
LTGQPSRRTVGSEQAHLQGAPPTTQSRLAKAVPPADLLDQVEGIEQGLQQRKRLGAAGVIALALSVLQIALAVGITGAADLSSAADDWLFLLGGVFLVFALLLLGRARFWIRESKQPFRYTYSISDLDALTPLRDESVLVWLKQDLTEKLASRIRRLSRLDEAHTEASDGVHRDTHIHVSASIGARRGTDSKWTLEVLPWVRIGPPNSPDSLAHPVPFTFDDYTGGLPPPLSGDDYQKLFERVYFSIATKVYERIREDVERKIDLLPGRYLRAVAYFHEASDYANSNTLDAYEAAEDLYERVMQLYDPTWEAPAESRWRRGRRAIACQVGHALHGIRLRLAGVWNRAGRVELLLARAQTGYANTLLYRRTLAGLSGRRLNPVFETRDVTEKAILRLLRLPADVPEKRDALFDAYVTRALALAQLEMTRAAHATLSLANKLNPGRALTDPPFLMVTGELEPRLLESIELYRRAVEVAPHFEAAQFRLAQATETLWRSRPELEDTVAEMVFEEYERVIRMNPGNLAAWANLGYMRWLLRRKDASQPFRRARDYKETKRDTFVSELDYGLARIAAEAGDFDEAYTRYIHAVAAELAQGLAYAGRYSDYYFASFTEALVRRFDGYEKAVEEHWQKPKPEQLSRTSQRVRDSVYAFVLNDCAEAHLSFYLRSGERSHLKAAADKLSRAAEDLQTRYVSVYLNLYRVSLEDPDLVTGDPDTYVEKIRELAPKWTDGIFTYVEHNILAMRRAMRYPDTREGEPRTVSEQVRFLQARAEELSEQAEESRSRASEWRRFARRLGETFALSGDLSAPDALPAEPPEGHWATVGEPGVRVVFEGSGAPLVGSEAARRADDTAASLERDAKRLDEKAAEHLDAAKELEQAMDKKSDEVHGRAAATKSELQKLLVHRALWRSDGLGAGQRFNWEQFRPDHAHDHHWERDLTDLDVRALWAWCETCLALEEDVDEGEEDGDQLDEPSGRDPFTREEARALANYIRSHFLGDDVVLLSSLLDATPDDDPDRDDLQEGLVSQIHFRIECEPAYWTLTWIQTAFPDQEVRALQTMIRRPDLPSHLEVTARVALGHRLFADEAWDESRQAYESARERDALRDVPVNPKRHYHHLIGLTLWQMNMHTAAVREFRRAGKGPGALGEIVGDLVARHAVTSRDGFFCLRDWLEEEARQAAQRGRGRRHAECESALRLLARKGYLVSVRRPQTPVDRLTALDKAAYVEPLVLLVDEAQQEELGVSDLDEVSAEIQAAVQRATGFQPPAVWIYPVSYLAPHRYSVLINGTPAAQGPKADGTLLSHVCEVVIRHLDRFADAPAVDSLFTEWALEQEERALLYNQAVSASGSLLRLVEVIRALLRERVPVHDKSLILAAFVAENARTPDIHDLIEKVRRGLGRVIADAAEHRTPVELPDQLLGVVSTGIRERDGDRFLAMSIADAYEAQRTLRGLLAGVPARDCAAVVPDPPIRPFTSELVAECCPELLVVTRDELR